MDTDISMPSLGSGSGWTLGSLGALSAYQFGALDVFVQLIMDWYPIIATLATKVAPEYDVLPADVLRQLMVVLALVVVGVRGKNAARNTAGRIRRFFE